MIKHIVAWNLKEEFSAAQKDEAFNQFKEMVEALVGVVPGLVDARIYRNDMASCTRELLLDSTLESEEALDAYQIHPAHVKVIDYGKTILQDRVCFDYQVR